LSHALAYVHNPQTTIVGGSSPEADDRLAFEKAFKVPAYHGMEEMIDRLSPDIVSICSPATFHFEQTKICLKRGIRMIWLEKPPASSLSELDDLIELEKRGQGKSRVLVNYHRRYMECYRELQSVYRKEVLGKCRFIHVTYSKGLEANGSHMLDILFSLMGGDRPYSLKWVDAPRSSENPSFGLSFEEGPGAIVSGIDLPYHCVDISLTCDQGRISILHGGMTIRLEEKVEHELFPGFYRLKESPSDLLGSGGFGFSMEEALKDLIDSFENGCEPQSSLPSSRSAQALIEQLRQEWRKT
jgi:predicted dehydrogenase